MTAVLTTATTRVARILEAAASGPDRVAGQAFLPIAERRDEARDAAARWLDRAAGPHATALADYLAATGRDLEAALSPVRWISSAPQPEWVEALLLFLAVQGSDVTLAQTLLPETSGMLITEDARAQLDATLDARIAVACQRVPQRPGTRDEWLDLLETRPGLAYAIGIAAAQWRTCYAELFARLATDLPLLQAQLWDGAHPGAIVRLRGDAGDQHAGGRSVALLDFAGGQAIAYKSKDLRHVAAVQRLLEFATERGARPALRPRQVVTIGTKYGWESIVAATPAPDETSFALYYQRLGMLTRLMQLLGGRDLWADNLVADGAHPVFIDLECMLAPRPRPLPMVESDPAAVHGLESTVVATSIPVQPWSDPLALPLLDVGCLSPAGDLARADGNPQLPLPAYRPFTLTATADAWHYADDVIAGYRNMHAVLAQHRDELLADDGPLAGLRGVWVRHIRRNTWDCYQLIRAGVSGAALDGGVEREIVLAGLMRSVFEVADVDRTDLIEMVLSEIDALRQLDVPIFGSHTTSPAAVAADRRLIDGHFARTGWDLLRERVAELDTFDLDHHTAVLASSLDAARDAAPRPGARQVTTTATVTYDELITGAHTITGQLLAQRFRCGDWIAQTYHPVTGIRTVECVGADLGSGAAGFAVLLAESAAATGDPVHRAAALDVLEVITRLATAMPHGARHQRIAGAALAVGGLAGIGSTVHALARVSSRLHEPALLTAAVDLLRPVAEIVFRPPTGARAPRADLPTGWAGLTANLLRLHAETGAHPLLDQLLTALTERLTDPARPVCTPGRAARSVPAGEDGVRLVLHRLGVAAAGAVPVRTDHGARLVAAELTGSAVLGAAATTTATRLDQAELHLAAGDRGAAARTLSGVLAGHRASGRWYPDRYADDRITLGALDGTARIALLALAAADPATRLLSTLH